MLSTYKIMNF